MPQLQWLKVREILQIFIWLYTQVNMDHKRIDCFLEQDMLTPQATIDKNKKGNPPKHRKY